MKDLIPCWLLRRAIRQRATTMVRGKQWKAGTQNEDSNTRVNRDFSLSHRVAFIVQNILVHEGAATSKKPSVTNRPPMRYLIYENAAKTGVCFLLLRWWGRIRPRSLNDRQIADRVSLLAIMGKNRVHHVRFSHQVLPSPSQHAETCMALQAFRMHIFTHRSPFCFLYFASVSSVSPT